MLKHHDSIQLELNFNGTKQNRFRERTANGVFQVLAEIHTPSADTKLEHAVERFADFQYLTESAHNAALALIHTENDEDTLDPVRFLGSLAANNPDRHLLYLRGRSASPESIFAEAKHALSMGIKNFCAVSGTVPQGLDVSEIRKTFFLESVNTLRLFKDSGEAEFFPGAVVNPYKYTSCDSSIQYFKTVKKINCGAQFLVTQFGWDMLKLQELRWNLWRRNINVPVFARLLYLTRDRAADICAGKIPGISISPDFEALLRRELQYSSAQFQTAQIARIQLHAAGAKLLGFSGVQIAGIDSPELFDRLLRSIDSAVREYPDFEAWSESFRLAYDRIDMAPYPYRFYLFDNLFSQAQPPDEFALRNAPVPDCTQGELFRFKLASLLFAHAAELPAFERKLTKKLLLGCRSCDKCRVSQTFYICPELCPKGMANGPCGASEPDGSCPHTNTECTFSHRMRLANVTGDFLSLENICVETTGKRPK